MNIDAVKCQFLTCLRAIYRHPGTSLARWRQGVEARDPNLQQLNTMVDQLWDCWDRMSAWARRNLGLGKPSTSHDTAIQLSLHQLNELSDTDSITAVNDLFRKDYGACHPGAPKALIPPNMLVFVSWLRAYWPGEVEELIAQFLQSQAL